MKEVKRIQLGKNKYIAENFYNVCYWWIEVYDHSHIFKGKNCIPYEIAQEIKKMLKNLGVGE